MPEPSATQFKLHPLHLPPVPLATPQHEATWRDQRPSMLEAAPLLFEYARREFPVQVSVHVPPALATTAAAEPHAVAHATVPAEAGSCPCPGMDDRLRGYSPEAQKVDIIRVHEPRRLRVNTVLTKKPVGTVPVVVFGPAYRALSPRVVPVPYMCVLGQPKNTGRAPPMSKKPYSVAPRRR